MEIFCLGGFVLWGFCVVLLAMISAARNLSDAGNKGERSNPAEHISEANFAAAVQPTLQNETALTIGQKARRGNWKILERRKRK